MSEIGHYVRSAPRTLTLRTPATVRGAHPIRMVRRYFVAIALCIMAIAMPLRAANYAGATKDDSAAAPAAAPSDARPSDDAFADAVDLSPLEIVSIQHSQTMKTLDSFARQMIEGITGHTSLDGRPPLFTVLDISFHPEKYRDRNIIKIANVPVRKDLGRLDSLDAAERERIVREGTVSLSFWARKDVQALYLDLVSADTRKASALEQVDGAARALASILGDDASFPPMAIVPPPPDAPGDRLWRPLDRVAGNIPAWRTAIAQSGRTPPAPVAGYDSAKLSVVFQAVAALMNAWRDNDAPEVNRQAVALADALPPVNPAAYPSALKRQVEVTYNHWARLTIPGSALYMAAFICFAMSARSGVESLRLWGLRLMIAGFAIHTTGIAVRWWLVGDIFPPIKNEFESVMFSAFFGVVVGLILELRGRRGRSLFGAAASFIGSLSLLAIFAVPYVTGREIGGEINQVNGVLMSYWLYIHVTMVTASYALIGMAFVLSSWWLIRYFQTYHTLSPSAWRRDTGDKSSASARHSSGPVGSSYSDMDAAVIGSSGAAVVSFRQLIAQMFFLPVARPAKAARAADRTAARAITPPAEFLTTLDRCNLVVLQLAFFMLGTGIVLGAIWADQSWGRPWGWDPKETFALVTWIVYLITVHARVATVDKAWWTAVLGVVGFFIMLFNWIGVNFFLVGLHSYA